ncbi:MAG TPA: SRPBCC family protein [Candidatus Kapabacteria bacterium]|nr:SRPBCC family protein [Candidatus Kapabacteria bacterium]
MIDPRDLEIHPLERSETIPSAWYTDPGILDLEYQHIFRRTWQLAGRKSELTEQGSHIIATAGKEPIIVVRGKDGEIRAFYNVCRHRGGPLAIENGCSSMLQCKYHGWTYQLDGMLRGVPDFDRVELFDKKDYGLISVTLEEWEGLLFVALDEPIVPLAQMLAGISERIRNVGLGSLTFYKRITYDINCNWKVYVDNYLEGYHVPLVHPELFKMYDFNQYKTDTFEWYSLQHSPLRDDELLYSTQVKSGSTAEALYYFIFPNMMLNILPGRLQTNVIQPLGADRCRVIFDYYYEDITSEAGLKHIEEDIRFSDAVQAEDIEICELVQRGLNSSAYDRGRFSVKRENAVWHFQSLLKRSLSPSNAA